MPGERPVFLRRPTPFFSIDLRPGRSAWRAFRATTWLTPGGIARRLGPAANAVDLLRFHAFVEVTKTLGQALNFAFVTTAQVEFRVQGPVRF